MLSALKIFWKYIKFVLYGLFGTLILIPTIVVLVFTQVPIFLYRFLLTKAIAPCFRPEICKAVSIAGQFQATEFLPCNGPTQPPKFSQVSTGVFRGSFTFQELHKLLLERWILAKRPGKNNKMELCYPELQQYIDYWMGFMFWKRDPNFNLNNHVICHELDKNETPDSCEHFLNQFVENLLNQPFRRKQSPWKMHLIRNYKTKELPEENELFVLVLAIHHAMADGASILSVNVDTVFKDYLENIQVVVPKIIQSNNRTFYNFIEKFAIILTSPFRLLSDYGYLLSIILNRQFPWKPKYSSDGRKHVIFLKSPFIPLEKLKFIKNTFGVKLSSVLYSSLATAVGKSFDGQERNSVRVTIMLPRSRPNQKLRNNNLLPSIVELDTQSDLDHEERLRRTEKILLTAQHSSVPRVMLLLMNIFSGSLAKSFAHVPKYRFISVHATNFPGPAKAGVDRERPLLLLNFTLGIFTDLVFSFMSCNGSITMCLSADGSVFVRDHVSKIMENFCNEIDRLYQLALLYQK